MRAAIKRGTRIVLDSVADPVPGPGHVLVRTRACGICGSDLHALHNGAAFARINRRPGAENPFDPTRDIVFGHEFAGEIIDYGPETNRRFSAGTLVTSIPRLLDANGSHPIGFSNTAGGGYAEQMLLSEPLLLAVPNGLSAAEAALTEPFAVGEHAVAAADLRTAQAALVVGCGPIGLAVIAALKARGFGPVVAADFAPGRRALAEFLGADVVLDPALESPHRCWEDLGVPKLRGERLRLQEAGGVPGQPAIFECVGAPGVIQSIIEGAPSGAQIIVVGVCREEDRFEPGMAISKELSLRFVAAYSTREFAATLRNIAEGHIDAGLVVTRRIGLAGVADAFATLASPGDEAKIIIEPGLP